MPNLTPDQREKVYIVSYGDVAIEFDTLAAAEAHIAEIPTSRGYSIECREVRSNA